MCGIYICNFMGEIENSKRLTLLGMREDWEKKTRAFTAHSFSFYPQLVTSCPLKTILMLTSLSKPVLKATFGHLVAWYH